METRNDVAKNQILQLILADSLTAPDIVKKTGLSRPTVDSFLTELLSRKIIRKQGVGQSSGGRRPVLFSLNESGRYAIGVAVAIPKIAAVVVDLSGTIHADEVISIPIWSPAEQFISEVSALVSRLIAKVPQIKKFEGVGLAMPGLVDPVSGVSVFFSRLSTFYNTPVKSMLENKIGQRVYVSRYLGSAAYSCIFPVPQDAKRPMVYIELGEGIEMALFNEGRPYRGNILNEGGLGHMVIVADGRTCLCGAKGCLESYAANRVLIDEAVLRVRNGERSSIPTDRTISDEAFYRYVHDGDVVASEVAEQGMDYLALGIGNIVNLLNPAVIIISGAVASAGEVFLHKIRQRIFHYSHKVLTEKLEIRFKPLDLKEGAKGVGLLRLFEELKLTHNF